MAVTRERLLRDSGRAGHAPAARLLPGGPGPQRQAELRPGRAAADPDQAEVPDARAARLGLALEVQHVQPAAWPPARAWGPALLPRPLPHAPLRGVLSLRHVSPLVRPQSIAGW